MNNNAARISQVIAKAQAEDMLRAAVATAEASINGAQVTFTINGTEVAFGVPLVDRRVVEAAAAVKGQVTAAAVRQEFARNMAASIFKPEVMKSFMFEDDEVTITVDGTGLVVPLPKPQQADVDSVVAAANDDVLEIGRELPFPQDTASEAEPEQNSGATQPESVDEQEPEFVMHTPEPEPVTVSDYGPPTSEDDDWDDQF